tara:strand:+ start:299 stop:955 length:657 start_codon:yes stop_codon:yes gene_type:complete
MIKKKIKKNQILDFLEQNPNFFIENQDILSKINFPLVQRKNNESHKVISFKDWIIFNLKKVQRKIIENAKYNFVTQTKVHRIVLEIIKKRNFSKLITLLIKELPKTFELEIVSIVTSDLKISEKFNLIYKTKESIDKIYGDKNRLVMDAVENETNIFETKNKIYSNAIFSLDKEIFKSESLLVYGSKDKHFIDNSAYDLIYFLSKVLQEKLIQLSNEK